MLGRSSSKNSQRPVEDSQPLLAHDNVIFSVGSDEDENPNRNEELAVDEAHSPIGTQRALPLRSTIQSRETRTLRSRLCPPRLLTCWLH